MFRSRITYFFINVPEEGTVRTWQFYERDGVPACLRQYGLNEGDLRDSKDNPGVRTSWVLNGYNTIYAHTSAYQISQRVSKRI